MEDSSYGDIAHTHHVPHESGTCWGCVHAEESSQTTSLVTRVVVHFQEPVSLAWNRFNGNRESCQQDLGSSAAQEQQVKGLHFGGRGIDEENR